MPLCVIPNGMRKHANHKLAKFAVNYIITLIMCVIHRQV